MNKNGVNKDIMCIKVMNATEALVQQHKLYYSDTKPDAKKYNQVSTIFIIGEATNGKIPLIGICDATINECCTINPAFMGYAKGAKGWKYEWKLSNFQKVNIPDIRDCILEPAGAEDKKSIKSLQKVVYIESNNLITSKIGVSLGNNTFLDKTLKDTKTVISDLLNQIPNSKAIPLEKTYRIGDTVHLISRIGKELQKGIVIDVKDLIETEILYDQKLSIQFENNECREYSAAALRKLEKKNLGV